MIDKHKKQELMQILVVLIFIAGLVFVNYTFTGMAVVTNYTWETGVVLNNTVRDVYVYEKDFADNITSSWYKFNNHTYAEDLVLLMHLNNDSLTDGADPEYYRDNTTHVYDYSLGQHNGTLYGTAAWNITEKKLGDASIWFDGDSDYINLSELVPDLAQDTQGTIAFWAYLESDDGELEIPFAATRYADATRTDLVIMFDMGAGDDQIQFHCLNGGTPQFIYETPVDSLDVHVGRWVHVVGTQDGIEPHIYVNGVEPAITKTSTTDTTCWFKEVLTDAGSPADTITIGAFVYNEGGTTYFFDGNIDEFAIWNRSLTLEEVRNLYQRQAGGYTDQEISTDWNRISGDGSIAFPNVSYLAVHDEGLDIIDADSSDLWMRFEEGTGHALNASTFDTVWAKDSSIYVGSDLGLYDIDFEKDIITKYTAGGNVNFTRGDNSTNTNITQRNLELYYGSPSAGVNIINNDVNDIVVDNSSNKEFMAIGTAGGITIWNKTDASSYDSGFTEAINVIDMNKTAIFYANKTDLGRVLAFAKKANSFTFEEDSIILGDIQDIEVNDTDIFLATNNSILTYGMNDLALNLNYTGNQSGISNNFSGIALNGTYLYVATYNADDAAVTKFDLGEEFMNVDNWTNDDSNLSLNTNQTLALGVFANSSTRWILSGQTAGMSAIQEAAAGDAIAPTVNATWPFNNTNWSWPTHRVNLTYNVTDAGTVDNCTLFIDNEVNRSNSTIDEEANQTFNVTFADGNYLWNIQCEDNSGNLGNSSIMNFSLDTTAPTVNATWPFNNTNWSWPSHQVNLTYNVTDVHNVTNCTLFIDNEVNRSNMTIDERQNQTFNVTFADGNYEWNIQCRDSYDNLGNSSIMNFSLDTTPPTVNATWPFNNTNWSWPSHQVNLTYNVTDVHNVTNCTLFIDNEVNRSNMTIEEKTNQTFNVTFADGNYEWNIQCRDSYDNLGNSSIMNFSLDTTPPTVNATWPFNNTNWSWPSHQVNLTYNVTDVHNVTNCTLFIDNEVNRSNMTIEENTNQTFNVTFADGNYEWNIQCRDSYDNLGNSSIMNFSLDTTPPTVNATWPFNNTNWSWPSHQVNLTYNVTDVHNVTNCTLFIDNEVNRSNMTIEENTNQTFNVTFADGNYEWNIQCRDSYDNLGNSSIMNFSLDTTGPTVTLITANNTLFTDLTQLLQYQASDVHNITNCSLFIDNSISDSSQNTSESTTLNFTAEQTDGTYEWNIQCKDSYNNLGNSSKNKFIVSVTPEPPRERQDQGATGDSGSRPVTSATDIQTEFSGQTLAFQTLASGISTINLGLDSLESINLDINRIARDISFSVKETNMFENPPDEKVYRYFQIETDILKSNINRVIFNFKVRNNFGDIILQRYTNEWKSLPTKRTETKDGYNYYQAISYGTSTFAVTKKSEPLLEQPLLKEVAQKYIDKEKLSKKDLVLYAILPIAVVVLIGLFLLYFLLRLLIWKRKIILLVPIIVLIGVLIIPFTTEILYFAILPIAIILIVLSLALYFVVRFLRKRKQENPWMQDRKNLKRKLKKGKNK